MQDTFEKAKDWLTSDSIYGGVENYWIVGGAAAVLYFILVPPWFGPAPG